MRRAVAAIRRQAVWPAALVAVAALLGMALAPVTTLAADPSPLAENEAELLLEPAIIDLVPGTPVTLTVTVDSVAPVSSVTADVLFDKDKVRVTGIGLGEAFAAGMPLVGQAGQALDAGIAEANRTGNLTAAGAFLLAGMGELPSGRNVAFTLTFDPIAAGQTSIALSKAKVLDATATELSVRGPAGGAKPVVVEETGPDAALVAAIVGAVIVVLALVAVLSGAIPRRRLLEGPYLASLLLGLLPVAAFLAIVALLVVNAIPALETPGLKALMATKFSSAYSLAGPTGDLGLVPAAWGTILVSVIAICLALPVSIAMAVIASEFPAGPLGRLLRPLLGVLAGVPPIVYAVAGAVFVTLFVAPKFAGSLARTSFDPAAIGVAPDQWPPVDVPFTDTSFPWLADVGGLPNSTLLGAILVALLVIPFMTPLIHDAMRSVPSAAREASFALGASRWYTVRRVLLPHALPGIVAAVSLATLKAFGDVLILALAVGWTAERLPNPLVDVFERTSTLAAEGANLLGNLQAGTGGACEIKGSSCPVGYASALVLLVAAAVIVVVSGAAESRLRARRPS
ncbi:MAG TPA: ABC transporter permease subunit [Candidatus Limnocylindrales bacterium]|nr:ABC transporter permease subunit [Candidatus Limnocylindrales bacterium]